MRTNGRISRRALLRYGGIAVIGGAFSPLLLACGSSKTTPTTSLSQGSTSGSGSTATATSGSGTTAASASPAGSGASTTTAAADGNPTPGGTLTLGYLAEPPIMDPRVSGSAEATNLMINLFDTLVTLDRDSGELKPGLAASWDSTPDGKSFTFKLQTGVKFHDGTPFNAAAVKYTYDSIVDPALKSLSAIGALGPYDATTVIDDQTVTLQFKDAYAPLLNSLSGTILAPVSPTAAAAGADAFGHSPVGTGPFVFKEWKEKISLTMTRNPDYNWPVGVYQHKGPAYLDQIVVKFIPDQTTLSGSLKSGEITITDAVLPQDMKTLQSDAKFEALAPTVPGVPQILPINAVKSPTDDLRVRQAILYAIDLKTLVNTLWFGTVKVAHGPLASSTWGYNPKVESMYGFDTDKAAQLLDEAGWKKGSGGVRQKNGVAMSVAYITTSGVAGQAGELVQAYLTDVGIKVDLQVLEYAATADLYLAGKHNIARLGYTGVDPYVLTTLFSSRNIQGTNFNRTMKPDADLDKMLDDATAETDRDKRKQDYLAIQEYIMNQALMIPLWEQSVLWGASSNVKGLHPQVLGQIGFYDAWLKQ
jgi:peptide/nickel transport system substrate-binding protein